jgi:hypothetical protein
MMNFPSRETVERLRKTYPVGCRIVLDEMQDPFVKIPIGAQATCQGVDDAGNVMASWDCGSSLSVAWPVDRCHKVATEEEAKVTLNWYGKRQPKEKARCPRCGAMMEGATLRHALSRRADIYISDDCGMREALEDAGITPRLPITDWVAIKEPQNGGGKWNG